MTETIRFARIGLEDLNLGSGTFEVRLSDGRVVTLNQINPGNIFVESAFYVTGTWTPVLTFDTPGDLAVSYGIQTGTYTKIGNRVFLTFRIFTSTFTHTTATDAALITGLPYVPSDTPDGFYAGSLTFSGITKANYTQFTPMVDSDNNWIEISAAGSGQTGSSVTAANMPTGGTVLLYGQVSYKID